MSNTAEEIEDLAIEYADSKERRITSAWQGLKLGFIAGYSSKDARIKELEEQNKRYRDALTTRNDRIKFLEGKKDVPCYQLKKSIEELKARLEKAENKLEKAAGYVLDSGNRIFFAELESFLINKTE